MSPQENESTAPHTGQHRYQSEQVFFDQVAERSVVSRMAQATLDRYARPRRPDLFGKEKMFSLLPESPGLTVLEVGCGEGVASVQLAYRGLSVVGIDLSPKAIEAARRRASVNGVRVEFQVGNIERDQLPAGQFDVIWCDLILHHVVPSLPTVMEQIEKALKPGGLFIAREPIAYAPWLKTIRKFVPVRVPTTPDEQPFRPSEFAIVEQFFPDLKRQYFRILARLDRVVGNLDVLAALARLDRMILVVPGTSSLAGNAVMWAKKAPGVE